MAILQFLFQICSVCYKTYSYIFLNYYILDMDTKKHPNEKQYYDILRSMSPEQKLKKVFELNKLGKELRIAGLRMKYPELNDNEIHTLYIKTIELCHNRNY